MNDWKLPEVEATGKLAVVRTGPSGMVLGRTHKSEVFLRLFRPQGTRMLLATPDYATWLLALRAISLGAHLSIVSSDQRRWRALGEAITRCGGTVDLLLKDERVPGQGRPYRPSLVLHDRADGQVPPVGPWQTVAIIADVSAADTVQTLRNCDLALFGSLDSRGVENVRRAYVLTQSQMRQTQNLGQSDVVMAMPRRITRISLPPGPQEYRLLFN